MPNHSVSRPPETLRFAVPYGVRPLAAPQAKRCVPLVAYRND